MRPHLEVDASRVQGRPAETALSLQQHPTVLLGVVETPSAGARARQLFEEAQVASLDHLRDLELAIAAVRDLSDELVRGGDLYGPGLRELARNLAEDLFWKAKTLAALTPGQSQRRRGLD